jgi:hypothetical protein
VREARTAAGSGNGDGIASDRRGLHHSHFGRDLGQFAGFLSQRVTILAGSSESLISDSGASEFYHQRQRKEALSAEIKASLDLYFGAQGKEEKQVRLGVSELIFALKSKEAADHVCRPGVGVNGECFVG